MNFETKVVKVSDEEDVETLRTLCNTNQSQLSILIPSNQLPLLPLPYVVFGFNTYVNITTI
jgi:hypothetical protein